MSSKNFIYQDLKTNAPNCRLDDRLLQGSTNRTFAFTLFDRGVQAVLEQTAEVTAIVNYEPQLIDGVPVNKGSFRLDKNTVGYDIVIDKQSINNKEFSIVIVPFHEEFVTYTGNCEFILEIKEGDIETYTYSMSYYVDLNTAHHPQSIPNNLPTFKELMDRIGQVELNKAEKDLSNIDNATFKQKAVDSGAAVFQTGDEIVTELNSRPVGKRVSYNSLDDTPVIPDISNLSKTDLSNVSDVDFLKKAKDNGLAENSLEDVDLDKLGEKVENTDIGKQVKLNTTAIGTKANADMKNISVNTLSDKIKLTNAYMDLSKRIHPSTSGYTPEQIRTMFEASYFEPSTSLDLTQPQYSSATLYIQFNPTSTNQVINQILPPANRNQIVMVQFTPNTGVVNSSLVISPSGSDHLNGGITPVTIKDPGYAGYFLPVPSGNSYIFIPHQIAHDFSLAVSDDKNNVFLGKNSIQFKKATVTEETDMLVVTPDQSTTGSVSIIDKDGATTTDVTIMQFNQGTVTGDGAGKATIDLPSTGGSSLTFVDENENEFTGNKIKSISKKIRISNFGNGLVDFDAHYDDAPDFIFAKLGYSEDINTDFHDQRPYFGDSYEKTGMAIELDTNDKAYAVQEGDLLDPLVTGGTTMRLGMYFEVEGDVIATASGYVELKVIDINSKDYLTDDNNNPIAIRREYKGGQKIGNEILVATIRAKNQRRIAFEIDCNFPGQIIRASGNTAIYIQDTNTTHHTGLGELLFERHTGYTIESNQRYYGMNFMNYAAALVKDIPLTIASAQTQKLGNGLFLDLRTSVEAKIENYQLHINDVSGDLPVFCLGKIFDLTDTRELRNKNLNTKVEIENKYSAYTYALMQWTGIGEATFPILTGYNNGAPVFASGWVKVAEKFIPENISGNVSVDTNAFTVPFDAKQCAMILYPVSSVSPQELILGDFEIDVTPAFTKSILTNTSHISENGLEYLDYAYRSKVSCPEGIFAYRYTINETDTKLPIGKFSDYSNNNIINDNSWHDAGSNDPNKVQGDIKFKVDGTVNINYYARVYNETNTVNDLDIWLSKVNGDGTFTEVLNSRLTTTVKPDTTVGTIVSSNVFTFKVKANESYRLFGKSNKSDGVYVQCSSQHEALLDITYDFKELTEDVKDILDLIEKGNEIKFVENGKEVFNKTLQYDVNTGKMTVVDKVV